jgi:hypothetical protein
MKPSLNASDFHQSIDQDYPTKKDQNFKQFNFLRAVFVIVIVASKTKIFYLPETLMPNSFTYSFRGYILSGIVGALAVPTFLQMSLFLFHLKSEKLGIAYFFQKRLPRLISLYVFWVGSITLFDILFRGKFESLRKVTSSLKSFAEFVVSGNSTPYFFFFSLIFVTVITEIMILLFSRLRSPSAKTNISYCLLFASSILVFTFSTIEPIINHTDIQLSLLNFLNNITRWDYNPLSFLPYVFTTAIAVQEYNEGKLDRITKLLKIKLYFLLFLTTAFFILECTLTSKHFMIKIDRGPLDHYMRLSLVFGSWLLLYLALLAKYKVPAIVEFISKCSLGIYGFHVFFTFERAISFNNMPFLNNLFQAVPVLEILTGFFTALISSIILTLSFKRLKNLIN